VSNGATLSPAPENKIPGVEPGSWVICMGWMNGFQFGRFVKAPISWYS
jgi:hypothetical protein